MKLGFVTQVYDAEDAVLGFVPRWVEGLAKNCEKVCVVALKVGDVGQLPANVEVREMGQRGKIGRYMRFRKFLSDALGKQGFEALLAHMVPRYARLADRYVRKNGGRTYLWYTHKGVDSRLLKAIPLVDKVFTASAESMRVDTPKKVVTGHGIDLQHFDVKRTTRVRKGPHLLSVGRLTPSKDPITALRALAELRRRGIPATMEWVGAGLVGTDVNYSRDVLHQAEVHQVGTFVEWGGMLPYLRIPKKYSQADLMVSTSLTGSVDKVVLEAMASRLPVIASGEAYPPLWTTLGQGAQELQFKAGDHIALANGIEALWAKTPDERQELGQTLRDIVSEDHEVDALMARLVAAMSQ